MLTKFFKSKIVTLAIVIVFFALPFISSAQEIFKGPSVTKPVSGGAGVDAGRTEVVKGGSVGKDDGKTVVTARNIPKAQPRAKTVAKGRLINLITVPKSGDKVKDVAIQGLYGGLKVYVKIKNNEAQELEKQSSISYDSRKIQRAKKLREFADMASALMVRFMQRIASCQYQLDDSFKQDLARVLAATLGPAIISDARDRGQTAVFGSVVDNIFNAFKEFTGYLDQTKGQGKKSADIALELTIIFLQQLQNIASKY